MQSELSSQKLNSTEYRQAETGLRRWLNRAGAGLWLPPLAYLLLTLVMTWPLALHLGGSIPRGVPDSWQNIWNFWWMREALFERHTNPYQTDMLFFPFRDSNNPLSLYYHTLQPALSLPGSLLSYVFSYALTYNLLVLVGFVATGWAMYALAHYFVQNRAAAFVAGVCYTFSPFHWHNLAQGQTSVFWLQWLPLYILLLHKSFWPLRGERRTPLYSLLAALTLTLTFYTDLYYTLYLILYTAALSLILLVRWLYRKNKSSNPQPPTPNPSISSLILILLPWAALVAPLVAAMLLNANDPTIRYVEGREVEILQSAALPSLFTPSKGADGWFPYFLGYSTLALAALGLWRSKWRGIGWAALALLAATMALGPHLRLDQNQRPEQALNNLPLPYLLFSKLPLVSNGRSPIRFMALAQLGLSMLAGWGVVGLGDLASRFVVRPRLKWGIAQGVAALALLVFLLEVQVLPLALQPLPRPEIFNQIAADPDKTFGLLELPLTNHYTEDSRRMYFQALHHHPITGGYISRRTEDYDKLAGFPFRQIFGRTPVPADPLFDTGPVGLRLLNFYNIRYVINYRDEYPADDSGGFSRTEDLLARLLGPSARVYADDLLTAYRVPQEGGAEPFPIAAPGFLPAEKLPDGRNYRWAGQDASLTIAIPAPGKVQLRFTAWSFAPEDTLDIRLNGKVIAQLHLTGAPTEMQTPPLDLPSGSITLSLHSAEPARSPKELGQGDDDRKLAFALSSVQVAGVGG